MQEGGGGEKETQQDWNPRQLFGFEYTQRSTDLPKEINWSKDGELWSIDVKAKAKNPPEVSRMGSGFVVMYFDAKSFVITSKASQIRLDLVEIVPKDWELKMVDLTSGNYMPPEVHDQINGFVAIDDKENEVVTGHFPGLDESDDVMAKVFLWNVLISRFLSEVGEPYNQESMEAMREAVLEKRGEILEVLSGKREGDPRQIALQPYTKPTVNPRPDVRSTL